MRGRRWQSCNRGIRNHEPDHDVFRDGGIRGYARHAADTWIQLRGEPMGACKIDPDERDMDRRPLRHSDAS